MIWWIWTPEKEKTVKENIKLLDKTFIYQKNKN